MSDDVAPAPAESAPAPKGGGDFLKTYVIGMALVAVVLGVFCWKLKGDKEAYEAANAKAEAILGGGTVAPGEADKPTTIRALAVGIHKYVQTYKEARPAAESGPGIPGKLIRERAEALGLAIRQFGQEQTTPVRSKGYEEVSATITFDPTNLEILATFLINLERTSRKIRVLDVRWDLRPDKENPYAPGKDPGHQIQAPQVKVGFRRPIGKSSS
jgi:hypothetical protein